MNNYNITQGRDEITVTFSDATSAQSGKALMLLMGIKPDAINLAPENWEAQQTDTAITIKGVNASDFDVNFKRAEKAVQKLTEFAAKSLEAKQAYPGQEAQGGEVAVSVPIKMEAPRIRFSRSEQKFEVIFPCPEYTDDAKQNSAMSDLVADLLLQQ